MGVIISRRAEMQRGPIAGYLHSCLAPGRGAMRRLHIWKACEAGVIEMGRLAPDMTTAGTGRTRANYDQYRTTEAPDLCPWAGRAVRRRRDREPIPLEP